MNTDDLTPYLQPPSLDSDSFLPLAVVWRGEDGFYAMATTNQTLDDDWNGNADVCGPADTAAEALEAYRFDSD
jgi:hypothetical protein